MVDRIFPDRRLEEVFEAFGKQARGKTCPAIDGILEEGSEILEEYQGAPALDAGLVAAAQAVEHYEIARYGTLIAWAEQMGKSDVVALLNATLKEELATDEALSGPRRGRRQSTCPSRSRVVLLLPIHGAGDMIARVPLSPPQPFE
ncbi:hypothetical protein GCM10010869_53390 [Mesorhizobium tianshanense]|uniref:Uncharacterized protein DUF892 n=1 Tax=Mesorhizobium tianshanense TaxID=39844 RepID=A0A562N7Y2_9HYPH|nr:uncharacterized protein DUF892 [Mesorhizobium tianshanense]GLS39742.1 hypothetical protein GCM10010869_53390 [Mesorhizobium tianshanense]